MRPRRGARGRGPAAADGGAPIDRIVLGALAGLAGTVAMTAAMRATHRHLPAAERYPLPPREIIEGALPEPVKDEVGEQGRQTATLAAHFGYGALTGAAYGLAAPRSGVVGGAVYGVLVWAGSYFGLMPGLGVLKPAQQHPAGRNLLMIGAHLVWGGTLALTLRELEHARREIFATDVALDRPRPDRCSQARRRRIPPGPDR